MVSYTSNLRLRVPVFDQEPWDEDINGDLYVLDAAIGKFFGVANLAGIWKNDTAYVSGQSAVDYADGSIWTCVINHTSPIAPTTFAIDRQTNPGRWVESISTAQEYAEQSASSASSAASSATAAAGSATDAANSASAANGALPLIGGTMLGPIILAADPSAPLGAASKQYVDARVGGTGFLATTGGTMTGPITLSGDPTNGLHAAPRQYVDTFMPRTGGTFTGPVSNTSSLYVAGSISTNTSFILNYSGGSFSSDASWTSLTWDSSNWKLLYNRSNGYLYYQRGYDGAFIVTINSGGGITAAGNLQANNGRIISYGAGNPSVATYNSAGYAGGMWTENSGLLCFGWTDGGGGPIETRFYLSRDGGATFQGPVYGTNGFTAWSGNINANAGTVYGNSIWSRANVYAGNIGDFYLGLGGAGRILNFASGHYLDWNPNNGNFAWMSPGGYGWLTDGANLDVRGTIVTHGTGIVYQNIGGSGFNFRWDGANILGRIDNNYEVPISNYASDERLKTNIVPSTFDCLGMANQIPLYQFQWKRLTGAVEPHVVPIGFVAQRTNEIFPDAVVPGSEEVEGAFSAWGMNTNTLLATLIGAVQQLTARIEALENA